MEDVTQADGTRGKGVARLAAVGVVLLVLADLVLLGAAGSLWGQYVHSPRLAAIGVGGLALILAVGLPVGGAVVGIGKLRARGVGVRPTLGWGGVALWNALLVGAVVGLSPEPVQDLLLERGTWVVDGLRGEGPFGPAAVPMVQRQVEAARQVDRLEDAVDLMANASAAGEAVALLIRLDQTRSVRTDASNRSLDRLLGRWDLDLEAARAAPDGVEVPVDGRGLLRDAVSLQPDGGARWSWPAAIPEATAVEVRGRRVMALEAPAGWEVRYEEGAWRLYTGDVLDHVSGGGAEAVAAPAVMGRPAAPEVAAKVRRALEVAARGRSGWMAGTTAWQAPWPEALSGRAAVYQGERVRAWCAGVAGDDAAFQAEQGRLFSHFGFGVPTSALTGAQIDRLAPEGRTWLAEVLGMCRPFVTARQEAEARQGLAIPDRLRARWAERYAADLVAEAKIEAGAESHLVTVTLPGDGPSGEDRVRMAILEDGVWRMEWSD